MRSLSLVVVLALAACRSKGDPDPDADGVNTADGDCEPFNAAIAPGVTEVCNGLDDDCSGAADDAATDGVVFFEDADGDGYGDSTVQETACAAPPGFSAHGDDCDDADPSAHPGATEAACTGEVDLNCDGSVGFEDNDGDGASACVDCNDADDDVHPGASETCNDADDDCDGLVDDDASDAKTYALDLDGDGVGNAAYTQVACAVPDGYAEDDGDCDDLNPSATPGAQEQCDGVDNDCDGAPDNGVSGQLSYYADNDSDGFGNANDEVQACAQPVGYVRNFDDCDDVRGTVHPGAAETNCKDPVDYNCDGSVGTDDGDADGFAACDDCDDQAKSTYPGAVEACNEVDDNCDGEVDEIAPTWYADIDGDGAGGKAITTVACTAPSGFTAAATDCNDLNPTVNPAATELCDGVDTNCDGTVAGEADADNDRWRACEECSDTDSNVHPGAPERCNGADDDCDVTVDEGAIDGTKQYADGDSDGYGDVTKSYTGCTKAGYVDNAADCLDTNANVSPIDPELCNNADDDCDGNKDESPIDGVSYFKDNDADGYGVATTTTLACSLPSGFSAVAGDCNDTNNKISPSTSELCNSVDDDCDGTADDAPVDAATWYKDADTDGYGLTTSPTTACAQPSGYVGTQGDCNDGDKNVNPGASDIPFDAVDQDCKSGDYQPATCKSLHLAFPALTSGTYTIDVDGPGGNAAVTTYCDMSTDGGGWTLASYSFMASTTSSGGTNGRSLRCSSGTWAPTARSSASAALGSVVLAQSSTEMAIAMTTNGSNVATGGLNAYQYAWKWTIPNPSKVTFVNHAYTYAGNWNTTDAGVGPCVAVTVNGIVGDSGSYSKYILQNVLGTSWTDTYPTGYGVSNLSSCVNHDGGPFVTTDHSGSHRSGGSANECDVVGGSTNYSHRGNYTPTSVSTAGAAAIWFR